MSDNRPFAGITVVEFGQFVVVPVCSQFLADGGARVVKVESPSGDPYRSTDPLVPGESRQFITKNRGKESFSLNLAAPQSEEIVERLVRLADVVLVNMRPETIERRGLDYARLQSINPRLIYGKVSAFGGRGPEAKYGGMDVVAQARSGLLMAAGAEKERPKLP